MRFIFCILIITFQGLETASVMRYSIFTVIGEVEIVLNLFETGQ